MAPVYGKTIVDVSASAGIFILTSTGKAEFTKKGTLTVICPETEKPTNSSKNILMCLIKFV